MQPTSWFLIRWISRFWKRTSWIWNPKNINPPMQLGPFNFCILVFIKYIYAVFYFWLDNGELKIPRRRRRRPRKRRLKISEVEFFQFYTDYSNFIYFVKCKRTLFEQNSYQPYSSSERERKFRRRLFTSSIKREIRNFHVVVVQWRQRNVQKSVMHVQSCCFAFST